MAYDLFFIFMNSSRLLHAIQFDSPSNVQQILTEQDININETTQNGKERKTALYLAVERGNLEIVQLLLSQQLIDVNKKSILILEEEYENNYYFGENGNEHNTFGQYGGYHARMSGGEAENYCKAHNNTFEKTALYLAIEQEKLTIVQQLLSHSNIDVNCLSIRKYCAMRNPNDEQSIDHNYWNTQAKGPIHIAIEKKNQEIVQLLLNHRNIDINLVYLYEGGWNFLEKYSIKKSPLCVAIESGNLQIFQLILNHPNTNVCFNIEEVEENEARAPYVSHFLPLHLAVKKNEPQIVKLLLKKPEVDVNSLYESRKLALFTNTALNMAVEQENVDIVRLLLYHPNINVNIKYTYMKNVPYKTEEKKDMTALFIAIEKRNIEITKLLLNRPEIDVNYPFSSSMKKGYSVYQGIDTLEIKKTPLFLAIENGDNNIVDFLLMKNNINVNEPSENIKCNKYKDNSGEISNEKKELLSPLFLAIQKNNVKIVDHLLLKPQIDLNFECLIQNQDGLIRKTAIELAHENENKEINDLLNNYI